MSVDDPPSDPRVPLRHDDLAQSDLLRKWAAAQVRFGIARQALELARHALLVLLLAASVVTLIIGMLSGEINVSGVLPRP